MPLEFDHTTTAFSPKNALYLATASAIAYKGEKASRKRAEKELGLADDFQFFDIGTSNTQAFAVACPTHAVVSFRGTQPNKFKDWMTDLHATPAPFRWLFANAPEVGSIHAGFGHAVVDAWSRLGSWIKENGAKKNRTVWFTGHSLGGALAAVAAGACTFDPASRVPVNGVYTFGQPRFAFHDFALHYDSQLRKRHFRFVNRDDLVPRVPFRGMDYADPGQMIHFDRAGVARVESTEWNNFLSRTWNSFTEILDIAAHASEDIANHDMEEGYLAAIKSPNSRLDLLRFG